LPCLIENLDLHVAIDVAAALVIGDLRITGGWGPVNVASPSAQPPPVSIHWTTGRNRQDARLSDIDIRRERAQRRDVVDDPDAPAMRRQNRSDVRG
jgi:hypothetical protein